VTSESSVERGPDGTTITQAGEGSPRPYLLLTTVSLGMLLAPLNSTMIAVALPGIRDDFAVGHTALGWLVSAYLITMAVAQPVAGRLGDQLGRARVFRASLLIFLACSLLAALSPVFAVLVLLRTGQAMAGAALVPNGMGMLRAATPVHRLGRMNGLSGSIMGISAAAGPLIGAAVLATGSWRGIFLLNVPFVLASLALFSTQKLEDGLASGRARLDAGGIGLLTALLVLVTLLIDGTASSFGVAGVLLALGTLASVVGLLVASQRRTTAPVAEWTLFRSRPFSAATIYVLLTNLAMYTTLLAIPFFITEFQGHPASTTGLLLGAMSVSMALMAPLSGVFADRAGRRRPAVVGAVAALAGAAAILLGLREDTTFVYLAASLAILGFGIGMGTGPATTAAIESAPREAASRAAGTASMMRYAGSILGAGVLAGVLDRGSDTVPDLGTFRIVVAVVVVMAALAIVSASRVHRFPTS